MGARTVIPMFVLNFEKFKRKFMYFSVKNQAILVDICMNMCYAMVEPRRVAMYRKIMSFLEAWKESEHRKPLILQGARQVGKTYSILEFGRSRYENVAYFNFETNPKLNKTFE